MQRILFVDNEHIVVDSLLHFFNAQADLDLDCCGAYSATDALRLMDEMRVDILITDIRMPGMDGLALQQQVALRWPRCQTIFLTGYEQFDYVQQAIRGGGIDYLLKTESNAGIRRAVEKALVRLQSQFESDQLLTHAQAMMEQALPLLRHQLLSRLLKSETASEEINEQFKKYDIKLNEQAIWLTLFRLDEPTRQDNMIDLIAFETATYAKEYLGGTAQFEPVVLGKDSLALMFSFQEDHFQKSHAIRLQSVVEFIQTQMNKHFQIGLSACTAETSETGAKLSECLVHLEAQLNMYIGTRRMMLLTEDKRATHGQNYIPGQIRALLRRIPEMGVYLETGNRKAFFDLFVLLTNLPKYISPQMQESVCLEIHQSITALLLHEINDCSLWAELSVMCDVSLLRFLGSKQPWLQEMEALSQTASAVFDARRQHSSGEEAELVKRIQWTVSHNLGGDLSMIRLGDEEGMNPYYMARVYKQLSGETLKGYISRMRYEKACKLLLQGKGNQEVAAAIGFSSEQPFNRFFKSFGGKTPSEYKQNCKSCS